MVAMVMLTAVAILMANEYCCHSNNGGCYRNDGCNCNDDGLSSNFGCYSNGD